MTYTIHKLPACSDWTGRSYPSRYGIAIHDDLGMTWDGGEYATRVQAIRAATLMGWEARTARH